MRHLAAAILLLLAGLLPLAGCAAGPPNSGSSAPPAGISLRVGQGGLAATDARARDYCSRYGGTASRTALNQAPEGNARIAVYACHH